MKELIIPRILCLLIGYLSGNFMTAEFVTRKLTGKPCRCLGTTGNPGMANVMANLGFKPGILVLAGDLGKTLLAAIVCALLFGKSMGQLAVLYAGVGVTLGHDRPLLMPDCKGGKGVATSCLAIFLYMPLAGAAANIFGMLVVFATKYLCLGGIAIPLFFILPAFLFGGREAGMLQCVLAAVCFAKHYPAIRTIPSGKCEKTDVLGAIRSKFGKKR